MFFAEFVFEPAEGSLALDSPCQPARGALISDYVGEVGHVLVPNPGRQRLDDDQVQFIEIDWCLTVGEVVVALGSNVHIFARPHRREELAHCFETLLGSPVRTVEFPGIDQPMLIVSFPGGGHLSIEFIDDAPDGEHPRLGAWLELRADNPAAVLQAALDAGLTQVRHPGHPYYFMIPGGQVFTIAPTS